MPNDETPEQNIEVRTGTAVTQPTRTVDVGNLVSNLGTFGIVGWLVVTQVPAINSSIDDLKEANRAHFQAISDDRRIQYDQISRDLIDVKHNVSELRRTAPRPGDPKVLDK